MAKQFDRRIREYQTTTEAVAGTHFQIDYRLRPEVGFSLEECTFRILLITSLGTILPLKHEQGYSRGLARLSVDEVGGYILIQEDPSGSGLVTIALPMHLCSERESLTGLLQLIGNGGEYRYTQEYWIERVTLPPAFIARFQGPRFGVEGIRQRLAIPVRQPLGIVLKPRHGASIDALCEYVREALLGGCDFVCDDVLLTDPAGDLSFERRIARFVALAKEVSTLTGEKKSYICNINTPPLTAIKLANMAINGGADGLLANAFAMGLGGVKDLIDSLDDTNRVPVITTNMGVALMSRAPTLAHGKLTQTGLSESVFAKLCRLAGTDGVHTGTVGAECYGEFEWNRTSRAIHESMGAIRKCFAVAEGDLGLGQLWPNISSLGPDVLIEVASGIINYPGGPRQGAKAFRSFIDALDPVAMDDDEAGQVIARIASKDRYIRQVLDAELAA